MKNDYMKGWTLGAQFVDAWASEPRTCMRYAMRVMKERGDDLARGFFDAVMEGLG